MEQGFMREDLGRMAQHFERLQDDPTKPRLRCLLAGAAAGALGITVVPWLAAVIISGGW
jgi:hypothetical protein